MSAEQFTEGEELTEEATLPPEQDEGQSSAQDEAGQPLSTEEQLAEAQAQAAEYLDGWQRARAELQNYKKRVDKERAEMQELARVTVLGRFLDILDDFSRALDNAPEDLDDNGWFEGLSLIGRKFRGILEAEGVTEIDAEGGIFDPALHEAVTREDSEEHEEGEIIEVLQKGYMLGNRVVRPARVRVAG